MGIIKYIAKPAFCLLFALLAFSVSAQPDVVPVEKGDDGRKYYQHTVSSGHTLWGISKMYAVSLNDIRSANPGMGDGLQIGQVIKVPLDKVDRKQAKTAPELDGNSLVHTVVKGETLFGICRKYSIAKEALMGANPGMTEALTIGQEIRVPVQQVKHDDVAVVQPAAQAEDGFDRHVVQAGETVYAISQKYGLHVDSLTALNQAVIASGIKPGSILIIPGSEVVSTPIDPNGQSDTAIQLPTDVPQPTAQGSYNIAVFLPFFVDKNKQIRYNPDPMADKAMYPRSYWALDLYNGILMAVDSLKKQGLNVNMMVYDTGKDSSRVARALDELQMVDLHLIIGPMYNSSVEQVSRFAKEKNVHLVAPVSQSSKRLVGYPNVSRTKASVSTQIDYLASYLGGHYNQENVIVVKSPNVKDLPLLERFEKKMNATLALQTGNYRDSVLVSKTESNSMKAMSAKFSGDKINILVLPSVDEAYVSHFFTMLSALRGRTYDGYRFMVFGIDQWADYEGVDYASRIKYNLHLTSPVHHDFESERAIDFIRSFRGQFEGADPGKYSLLGFDVAYFYLTGLKLYGTGFEQHFGEIPVAPLSTSFDMQRNGAGNGFENRTVHILKYQDFELQKVN